MNKKLLVLALVGAFSAPAMADVTINGTINMGPQWGSVGTATPTTATNNSIGRELTGAAGYSGTGLTSNNSNVNINSTEDLGDGNKVVFNAQLSFSNPATNGVGGGSTVHETGNAVTQRNTFLGFEGGWGSLRMGINEHIYERYMYQSDTMDGAVGIGGNLTILGTAGYGQVFQVGNSGCGPSSGCSGFYRRSGNSIWYDSPDINGFTFGVVQSLSLAAAKGGPAPSITSLGVQFKPAESNFFVNVALERHKDMFGLQEITGDKNSAASVANVAGLPTAVPATTGQEGTSSTDTGMQIGGGVNFGDFSLFARYETLKYKTQGLSAGQVGEYKRDATWLGLKYAMPTGYATIQLGSANGASCTFVGGGNCDASRTGATVLSGGYAHNLSKQTQLQFWASMTSNQELASYYNIGSPGRGNAGADGRSIAVLVKHAF